MSFKQRLISGETTIGCFVGTPAPEVFEVLSTTELDCLCLDGEHSPFDRRAISLCVLAARSAGKPVLVRVPANRPEYILNALDVGASGVVVPHVRSAEEARAVARAAHYGAGGRGFAGVPRGGGYGRLSMAELLEQGRTETVVVAQIEDIEAVDAVEEIAAVDGIDALFVGRADLTVSYGAASYDDNRVVDAVDRVCAAGKAAGATVGMFLPRPADAPAWREKGASFFLLGSDHGFLRAGAAEMLKSARGG